MPHSSGGGSSGGGFHGGSSSSGPSYRTSSRMFPGATCYVYYGRGGRMHTVYTNGPVGKSRKKNIFSYVLLGVMMAAGVGVAIFGSFHNPTKLSTDYSTTITIQDDINVLSVEEENTLQNTFKEFFTLSGICPSVLTVNDSTWNTHYASLSGYAYDAYLARFKDESHWLIVYSEASADHTHWAFEGMQGNDTDKVLFSSVTSRFNESLHSSLSASKPLGASLEGAFRTIMPGLMDQSFRMETPLIIFLVIWEAALTVALVSAIINGVRNKGIENGFKVEGSAERLRCPSCGNEYIKGTIARCYRCGHILEEGAFEPHV